MRNKTIVWAAWACLLPFSGYPQVQQTDSVRHIGEVVVTSKQTFREIIPSQKLSGEQLERLNAHSVADVLRYFAGLQVKDYGGVGGLKTINIRSMGSQHLGVFYDGIELGNVQNGQVDLGQLSADNLEEITLYNGQKSAIFQPASDFGNAGSVYIRTRTPRFTAGKAYNLQLKLKHASSSTYRLSALWEQRISPAVTASLSTGGLVSDGKYPFRYRRMNQDGTVAYDTTAIRQNGDIWAFRAEGNLHGLLHGGAWNVKAYTYNSQRAFQVLSSTTCGDGANGSQTTTILHRHVYRKVSAINFLRSGWRNMLITTHTIAIMTKHSCR